MNKKLLCTAVGASLMAAGAPVLASHSAAVDDSVLIPYVVKDSNRTTVVTVLGLGNPVSAGPTLHLQYWTKSTTDANTAACQPSSVTVPFTENDTMTFDTAGILGYPLFGDTTNPAPLGASISYASPRHGYLVVEWIENHGQGYWMELDLANGGAHGDWAIGSEDNEGDFRNLVPSSVLKATDGSNFDNWDGYGALGVHRGVPFWPSSVVSTAFTVTPLGSAMRDVENNQVVIQVQNNDAVQGAYDRNENGVDGTVPVTVRCVGRVTPAQLMPGVVANAAWASQGGWGVLRNLGNNNGTGGYSSDGTPSDSGDLDAMVYQVDTSTAGGKFMSNATRIVNYAADQIGEYTYGCGLTKLGRGEC